MALRIPRMLLTFLLSLAAGAAEARAVELTILHTNDLHLHLRAAKIDPFGLGGLARMSSLLHQLRSRGGASLTLDAGDWSEGTWYFSNDTGANMLRIMDRMGYDAVGFGDHDFLAGPDEAARTIRDAGVSFPVLAANLDMRNFKGAAALAAVLPPYVIREIGGLRVGIIGLTTTSILFESFLAPVEITNALGAAAKLARELRPKVDALIVISHNDYPLNMAIARAVPGIDLIISGHWHKKTPHPTMVRAYGRDVPLVETGKWGAFVGEVKLEVMRGKSGRSRLKSFRLVPVAPELPEDPRVREAIEAEDAKLDARFRSVYGLGIHDVVAEAEFDIMHRDRVEAPIATLAVKAYRAATGADVALEESAMAGVDLARGPVTLMDLHDVSPHLYNPRTGREWTLQVWNARGADLLKAFNVFYTVIGKLPIGWTVGWLSSDNLSFIWEPRRRRDPVDLLPEPLRLPGSKRFTSIRAMTIGGEPLDLHRRYKVAMTEGLLLAFRLAKEKLRLEVDLSDVTDTGIEGWRSVVDYVRSGDRLTLENLRVGRNSATLAPDAAIFDYAIERHGKKLAVEVESLGFAPLPPTRVGCYAGRVNDFTVHDTPAQSWMLIGEASLDGLPAGSSASIAFEWDPAPGAWPVRCRAETVAADVEGYLENNAGERVFLIR